MDIISVVHVINNGFAVRQFSVASALQSTVYAVCAVCVCVCRVCVCASITNAVVLVITHTSVVNHASLFILPMQMYLKELLKEVCLYNTKAPHKNTWELKADYKRTGESSCD